MGFLDFHKAPVLAQCSATCLRKEVFLKILSYSQNEITTRNQIVELSYNFKFAILVSGFRSRLSPHADYFTSKRVIPTLHVIGNTDRIVEKGILHNFGSRLFTNYAA